VAFVVFAFFQKNDDVNPLCPSGDFWNHQRVRPRGGAPDEADQGARAPAHRRRGQPLGGGRPEADAGGTICPRQGECDLGEDGHPRGGAEEAPRNFAGEKPDQEGCSGPDRRHRPAAGGPQGPAEGLV